VRERAKRAVYRGKAAADSLGSLPAGGKFLVSVLVDAFDFAVGRIPGFGTLWDLVQTYLAYRLWGPAGLAAIWELVDVTEQVDGFVPTVTLAGVLSEVAGR